MTLTIDPEFRDLIPPPTAEERKGLEDNIKADGCHTPIFVWGDIIIDGHNRYDICTKHGIAFETQPWEFDSRQDARIWILRNQFDRRNLTPAQRMDLALLLKSDIQARAQERKKEGNSTGGKGGKSVENLPPTSEPSKTRDEVAKLAGVSGRTLDKYEAVKETATPELVQAVRDDRISVHAAAKAAKNLTPAEQIEVLKSAPGKIGKIVNEEVKRHEERKAKDEAYREYFADVADPPMSKEARKQRDAIIVQNGNLFDAIKHLSEMPDAVQVLSNIPEYQRKHLANVEKAHEWISSFVDAYQGEH